MANHIRLTLLLLPLMLGSLEIGAEPSEPQARFRGLPWQTSYPAVMAVEGDDHLERGETYLFYLRQTPDGPALVLYAFSEDQQKLIRGELWFSSEDSFQVIESLRDRFDSPGNSTRELNGRDDLWWQVEDTYVLATDNVPGNEEFEGGEPFRVIFLQYSYPHEGLEVTEEIQAE